MTPATIIQEARSDGVSLALSPSGTIKATGDGAAVNRWLAVIREHKGGIIEVLTVSAVHKATTPCQPVITGENQALDPEAWEERAAICEFDGGLDCAETEAVAWQEDDRRRCDHCQHYRREVCTIATPGGLVSANRGYRPWQGLPRRCAGFAARQEVKP